MPIKVDQRWSCLIAFSLEDCFGIKPVPALLVVFGARLSRNASVGVELQREAGNWRRTGPVKMTQALELYPKMGLPQKVDGFWWKIVVRWMKIGGTPISGKLDLCLKMRRIPIEMATFLQWEWCMPSLQTTSFLPEHMGMEPTRMRDLMIQSIKIGGLNWLMISISTSISISISIYIYICICIYIYMCVYIYILTKFGMSEDVSNQNIPNYGRWGFLYFPLFVPYCSMKTKGSRVKGPTKIHCRIWCTETKAGPEWLQAILGFTS